MSGVWLLALLLLARVMGLVPRVPNEIGSYMPILLWGGHILSPMLTAWGNPAFRPIMLKERPRYIIIPVLLLAGSVLCGVLGDLGRSAISPAIRSTVNPRFALFLLFLVWNTWHFASQHFGVLSIYRRVSGRGTPRDRTMDRYYTAMMGCVLMPLAWYSGSSVERLGPVLTWVGLPGPDNALATWIAVTAGLLTVGYMTRELSRDRRSVPRALYIFSIGIQPIAGVVAGALYQFTLFTVCHWMIALALSARITSHAASSGAAARPVFPDLKGFNRYHLAHVGLLIAFSIPLYYLLLRPPAALGTVDARIHFGYRLGETSVLLGAISGAYFGISFVHFMYDRFIYSFHKPEVRGAIAVHLFHHAPSPRR